MAESEAYKKVVENTPLEVQVVVFKDLMKKQQAYIDDLEKNICDDELINELRASLSNAEWRRIVKTKIL